MALSPLSVSTQPPSSDNSTTFSDEVTHAAINIKKDMKRARNVSLACGATAARTQAGAREKASERSSRDDSSPAFSYCGWVLYVCVYARS